MNNNFKIVLMIILLVLWIVFAVLNSMFDETPYAIGRYGRNVIHPESPYKIWMWLFGGLFIVMLVTTLNNKK